MIDSHRRLVDRLNAEHATGLVLAGSAEHGETGGAAYAHALDGAEVVITRATVPLDRMRTTAEVINEQAAAGLPVPEHRLVVALGDEVVIVQRRLVGDPVRRVDVDVVDAIVAANDRFADRLTGRLEVGAPKLYLTGSAPDLPRHETLSGHSARSRRLLRRIESVGAAAPSELAGADLVHLDLTAPNVLFDPARRVTGVVDWNNGAARGDRHFGLVKLIFDLTWDRASPGGADRVDRGAISRVEQVLHERLDPMLIKAYWAHWTLVMLHWTIRSGDAGVIDLHLDLGERVLG